LDPKEVGITRFEKIRRMQHQPMPMAFPKTDVQLGLTKVFMRKPPHDALEAHRVFHQSASVTMIQCWMRGMEQRKKYLIIQDSCLTIQRCYRGYKGRERWTKLRRETASLLLTNHYRMQISRRKYNRARKGTISLQAQFRGRTTRRMLAAIELETAYRKYLCRKKFLKLKSAVIALQCRIRVKMAKKVMRSLMGEQKDIGKLRENNERLKMEMNSLKAMLAAQAKEDASNLAHTKELDAKQNEINRLEKRVAELEKQVEEEKAIIAKLESDLSAQKEQTALVAASAHGHGNEPGHRKKKSSGSVDLDATSTHHVPHHVSHPPANYVSPDVLAKHKKHVAKLEEELRAERKLRREADGEIIKLRAAINGVQLNEAEVNDLLAQKLHEEPTVNDAIRYVIPSSEWKFVACYIHVC
jgi:myosin heavy subunit